MAAHQHQRPQRGNREQQVHLFLVAGEAFHIGVAEGGTGQRGTQHQRHVEAGKAIHHDQGRHLNGADGMDNKAYPHDREQGQIKPRHGQGGVPPVVAAHGDEQHDQDGGRTRDQQRQHGNHLQQQWVDQLGRK